MVDSAVEVLSANIRLLRSHAGLSLSGLAREAGLSKATLSELEAGTGNPTIETVFSLARALHTPVSGLLRETPHERVRLVQASTTDMLSGQGVDLRPLRRESTDLTGIEVYDQHFRSGAVQESAGHPGTEHTIVTSGQLAVVISGGEYSLGPGDAVEFDALLPHAYIPREGDVESVLILTYAEQHEFSVQYANAAENRHHEDTHGAPEA